MIVRPVLAVLALLLGSLGLVSAPAHAADCQPATSPDRGKIPVCDTPNGRTFMLTASKAAPGTKIGFTGTGFVRDQGGGQTLTFKLNDIDLIGSPVVANDDGTVTGSIRLPGVKVFKSYQRKYGSERWWVRVLVGVGRPDGEPDMPAATIHDGFKVSGLPSGQATRAVAGSVNPKATHLTLALEPGAASKTKLVVESLSPVPIGRKSRMITVATGSTKPKKKATFKLTKDGQRYFKRYDALYVAAVSKAPKSKAVTRIFKIEKKK